MSANYYTEIRDHDYCQNVPHKEKQRLAASANQLAGNQVDESEVNPEGSMLKSLLINNQLMEKMKKETRERRNSSSPVKSPLKSPLFPLCVEDRSPMLKHALTGTQAK